MNTTTKIRPAPNATVACPSPSAMRRHLAHGQRCRVCWPGTVHGLPDMPDVDYFTALGRRARRAA